MLGRWEFDALLDSVEASVFFGHACPDSEAFWVVGDVVATVADDWAGLTYGFCFVHSGCVATVDEEQVCSAFARCPVCPYVEDVGMFFGVVHS